ncbi:MULTISPECIES: prephenate dehydrogenase/arogenate dehydrogenase family protein [Anaerofustis]|uniref:prephenate dehydrogenase n=1 Tax=Anaerofustis TaxID=264995 RepID=UPI001105FE65|nr:MULTISPECIES: prephenate dehydrogenase/arogenate dehydrogenase family protein [Anaerofustis]MCO8192861.1 prephenate dehydrogenase/arogenate dehydrogenase family protein [Anaerofustis sp. NSJ-163]
MNIAVVGLGLIGASFAKAIKKYTTNKVFGYDIDSETLVKAKRDGAIDDIILIDDMKEMDMVVIALHPVNTINLAFKVMETMKEHSTLMDLCGVKEQIVNKIEPEAIKRNIDYVGAHPMAGRELWGYDAAVSDLFKGASFIVTVTENTNKDKINIIKQLVKQMKFKECVLSTPREHDKIIAFTSQLAHVVSNAYVKSPSILEEKGFSAGSFLDLTRVAKLNEYMWSELFIMNKDALLFEVENIIEKLEEYKEALESEDMDKMEQLLREGRILKEKSNEYHIKKC